LGRRHGSIGHGAAEFAAFGCAIICAGLAVVLRWLIDELVSRDINPFATLRRLGCRRVDANNASRQAASVLTYSKL
jgi:hypothetical protein